mgnify:CR=1 FL=1
MKKIIATVLAMVMALALCVTAFAATTENVVDSKGYALKDMNNTTYTITKDSKITIVKKDAEKVTVGNETTTTYFADKYVIDGVNYYACDPSIAEYKLIKDGKVVTLSTKAILANGIKDVVSKTIEAKAAKDQTCGDYKVDVYVIDNKAYAIDAKGSNVAMLNGLAVIYGAEQTAIAHDVDWTKKDATATPSYNAKGEVVSVKCACGTSFEVVKKVASTYTGDVQKVGSYYVLLGNKTTAAGTTTASGSPKTFDAGIAMYAGMALMSVAGSAVVIGKKKEF